MACCRVIGWSSFCAKLKETMRTFAYIPFRRRLLAGALAAVTPLLGWSQQPPQPLPPRPLPQPLPQQADPPARVAYVSALEGAAHVAAADASDWSDAAPNWPVSTGARIAVDPNARVELHGGTTVLRLAGPASLEVTLLDETNTQVALTEGALSLRVRELQAGDRVEVDTPQLAVIASQPGEYRVDVDPRANTTRVAVYAGAATVYGEAGQPVTIAERQQVIFSGRNLTVVQRGSVPARDQLDQWAAARDAAEDRSASARYVSRDMPGYQQLDSYGEWGQDPSYGAVWYPTVAADWAPYRQGRWIEVAPWGWTWVDDAPWGFAPSHYGRWAQIGPRWAWVPGPIAPRPVYAPALVGFVGGGGLSISVGIGLPAAAWFPLAPGEYWQPGYYVSDRYRQRVNWWGNASIPLRAPAGGYRFQRRPEAVSFAPAGYSGGARARFSDGRQLPTNALRDGRLVQPPPRARLAADAVRRPLPPRPGLSVSPRGPEVRAPRIGSAVSGGKPLPQHGNGSITRAPSSVNNVQRSRVQPQLQQQPRQLQQQPRVQHQTTQSGSPGLQQRQFSPQQQPRQFQPQQQPRQFQPQQQPRQIQPQQQQQRQIQPQQQQQHQFQPQQQRQFQPQQQRPQPAAVSTPPRSRSNEQSQDTRHRR
jgi:hypothetical protein